MYNFSTQGAKIFMNNSQFQTELNFSATHNLKLNEENLNQNLQIAFELVLETLKRKHYYVVSCSIVTKQEIQILNKTYRMKDSPTDVLSFAYYEGDENLNSESEFYDLGDIYICEDICEEQAPTYNLTAKQEVIYLFIHGLLHLFNYDHVHNEEEKKIMFDLQNKIFDCYLKKEV